MPPDTPHWADALRPAGGEAVLPAGSTLAHEGQPGHTCFVLLEGSAVMEAAGRRVGDMPAGSYVGFADAAGRPLPPHGVTVRLVTPARVLVLDAARLTVLIGSDPAAASAWQLRA